MAADFPAPRGCVCCFPYIHIQGSSALGVVELACAGGGEALVRPAHGHRGWHAERGNARINNRNADADATRPSRPPPPTSFDPLLRPPLLLERRGGLVYNNHPCMSSSCMQEFPMLLFVVPINPTSPSVRYTVIPKGGAFRNAGVMSFREAHARKSRAGRVGGSFARLPGSVRDRRSTDDAPWNGTPWRRRGRMGMFLPT